VPPDVAVDVFRTHIQKIANPKLHIAVFISRGDKALAPSETILGGVPRLGDIDAAVEPYHSELARPYIEIFDLMKLKSVSEDAHDRIFEDVITVVAMMRKRFGED
jgi:esterase/lipase superfamily enzyme